MAQSHHPREKEISGTLGFLRPVCSGKWVEERSWELPLCLVSPLETGELTWNPQAWTREMVPVSSINMAQRAKGARALTEPATGSPGQALGLRACVSTL